MKLNFLQNRVSSISHLNKLVIALLLLVERMFLKKLLLRLQSEIGNTFSPQVWTRNV